MSLSLDLLSVMLNRDNFYDISPYLKNTEKMAIFSKEDRAILNLLYFLYKNSNLKAITRNDLMTFYTINNKDDEDTQKIMKAMITKITTVDVNRIPSTSLLVQKIAEHAAAYESGIVINDYNNGKEVDLLQELHKINEKFLRFKAGAEGVRPISLAVSHVLERKLSDSGFRWFLPILDQALYTLYEGKFVIIAARPDTGKTTFLSHMVTDMAQQIDIVYPDENRVIYWFNNEGKGSEIQVRLYQSTFKCGTTGIGELIKEGTLETKYLNATGGRQAIEIYDIHGMGMPEVEAILKRGLAIHGSMPAGIVFDMLDNIKFDGVSANGSSDKGHDKLEGLYQTAREMGVKYDCPIIATSQLSADAEGKAKPSLADLAGSKTGKAGAADIIITIGKTDNPATPDMRTINVVKNKQSRDGHPTYPSFNATLYAHSGYYE